MEEEDPRRGLPFLEINVLTVRTSYVRQSPHSADSISAFSSQRPDKSSHPLTYPAWPSPPWRLAIHSSASELYHGWYILQYYLLYENTMKTTHKSSLSI